MPEGESDTDDESNDAQFKEPVERPVDFSVRMPMDELPDGQSMSFDPVSPTLVSGEFPSSDLDIEVKASAVRDSTTYDVVVSFGSFDLPDVHIDVGELMNQATLVVADQGYIEIPDELEGLDE